MCVWIVGFRYIYTAEALQRWRSSYKHVRRLSFPAQPNLHLFLTQHVRHRLTAYATKDTIMLRVCLLKNSRFFLLVQRGNLPCLLASVLCRPRASNCSMRYFAVNAFPLGFHAVGVVRTRSVSKPMPRSPVTGTLSNWKCHPGFVNCTAKPAAFVRLFNGYGLVIVEVPVGKQRKEVDMARVRDADPKCDLLSLVKCWLTVFPVLRDLWLCRFCVRTGTLMHNGKSTPLESGS